MALGREDILRIVDGDDRARARVRKLLAKAAAEGVTEQEALSLRGKAAELAERADCTDLLPPEVPDSRIANSQ
jgi:Protein of unknown function (DUF2786)